MGVNRVILLGNLGKDPELRYTNSQMAICSFSLATGERRKDQSGKWVDATEWHNIVVFGKTAENCANFLKKGRQAFVEGSIRTRKWQDKEGRDRYTTEIIANTVQFVGGGKGNTANEGADQMMSGGIPESVAASLQSADTLATPPTQQAGSGAAAGGGTGAPQDVSFDDDDIPF